MPHPMNDRDWSRLARYVGPEASDAEREATRQWIAVDETGERARALEDAAASWNAAALPSKAWHANSAWQKLARRLATAGENEGVILFDGVCNLCNAWVRFVIARDPSARFVFAPLQSDSSREMLRRFGTRPDMDLRSVIVISGGKVYDRSTAILSVIRRLGGAWKLLYALIVLPRPLRDSLYDWIARRRYGWFGVMTRCPLPTPAMRARFVGE
jgi:predicted DCC family thiol-disulfide oxidoreductase YuxK